MRDGVDIDVVAFIDDVVIELATLRISVLTYDGSCNLSDVVVIFAVFVL